MQPNPIKNENPHIADLVINDIKRRKIDGIKKYGTPLQAGNGRDALQDAYEEALDLCQYLKQAIEERNKEQHPVKDLFEDVYDHPSFRIPTCGGGK